MTDDRWYGERKKIMRKMVSVSNLKMVTGFPWMSLGFLVAIACYNDEGLDLVGFENICM